MKFKIKIVLLITTLFYFFGLTNNTYATTFYFKTTDNHKLRLELNDGPHDYQGGSYGTLEIFWANNSPPLTTDVIIYDNSNTKENMFNTFYNQAGPTSGWNGITKDSDKVYSICVGTLYDDGLWDSTPPTGSVSYSPSTWTNGGVRVTVTCSDNLSGCQQSTYSRIVYSNGSGYITIRDNVGNSRNVVYDVRWIDSTPPTIGYTISGGTTLNDTRTNQNVTATISCSDTGGSGCNPTKYYYQNCSSTSSCSGIWTQASSKTYNSNGTYYIRFAAMDNAGNGYIYSNVATIKIDKTPPTSDDIINSNPTNLLAINSKNFSFTVGVNLGSPITYIGAFFENYLTTNSFKTIETSTTGTWSKNENIQNVDSSRTDGARIYTLRVSKICDEAGNCTGDSLNTTTIKDYNYNIYANTTNLGAFEFNNTHKNDLISGAKIADGTSYPLTATLEDTYGNEIIPATGINRTIDFNFNTNNNLNENQYSNNGNAVYLTIPNDTTTYLNRIINGPNKLTPFDSQTPTIGKYPFNFKVYAPTNIANDANNHDFIINNVRIDINGTIGATTNNSLGNSTIDFNFSPLYTTLFSLEQETNGFIEGATQTGGIINITKSALGRNISSGKIKLEKAGSNNIIDDNYFNGKGNIDNSGENIFLRDGIKEFLSNLNTGTKNFTTLFTLDPTAPTIKDIKDLYVKSYLNYFIDLKEITYIGDIVGGTNNAANAGLKVYGITNIDKSKQREITTGQDNDIKNIAGKIDKASLRKDIKSKAYDIIKNIAKSTNNNIRSDDSINVGSSYLYYDLRSDSDKRLDLTVSDLNTSKTIIVLGGNLYITGNSTNGNNLPGIIVLKDENGNGGKLYIDPNVSKLDAIIYVDKSILSYNSFYGELSPDNGGTYDVLKKQLYIHGSVFSENTIGGSRMTPIACPFYLYSDTGFVCSLDIAQKYDLNYLRRGIKLADGVTNSSQLYPVIIEYNSKLQLNPPKLFSN